jgi:hypothetical protein
MATIPITTPAVGGSTLSTIAANGGGDQYYNTGKESLVVINGSGSSIDVTFTQQKDCSDGYSSPDHDIVTAVGAGATEYIPPCSATFYNDANNYVQVGYSAVTTVTVGVIKTL